MSPQTPKQERQIRLRGDGVNVTRYRARSSEPHEVNLYVDVMGEYTLAELVAFLIDEAEMRPDMGNITFRGGCFVSHVPATDEDVAGWEGAERERAERAERGRREWYERLRAEFDPDLRDAEAGGH